MTEEEFRSGVLADGTRLMQPQLRCQRLVVIESPYAGNIERNLAYARACMADSLDRGEFPFASHLLYTQPGILDDNDPADRALVETFETFPCDMSAWRAAKAYRVAFWALADAIDHRMGACI